MSTVETLATKREHEPKSEEFRTRRTIDERSAHLPLTCNATRHRSWPGAMLGTCAVESDSRISGSIHGFVARATHDIILVLRCDILSNHTHRADEGTSTLTSSHDLYGG